MKRAVYLEFIYVDDFMRFFQSDFGGLFYTSGMLKKKIGCYLGVIIGQHQYGTKFSAIGQS